MAKQETQARKHHYIPCMLLSKFGTGDGRAAKVWVWDKETGKVWNARVDTVGYQNDLYRIPTEHLEKLDPEELKTLPPELRGEQAIENMFGLMEDSLAVLIQVMESTLTLPPEPSDALTELLTAVALFDIRTPAKMEQARQLAESVMNMTAEINIPDFADEQRVSVPFKPNRPQLLASVLQHLPHFVETMQQRHWSLRVSNGADYILTDYPVLHVFSRQPVQRWDVPAPAVKRTMAFFPLTRSLLLVGEYEVPSAVRLADDRWVGYHNSYALGHAERFLFTYENQFKMLSNERGLHAYAALYESDERLFTMTPELFADAVRDGDITKPQRMTINGVAPEDYRWNSPIATASGFNNSPEAQLLLKNTFLDEDGQEVPIAEVLRQRDQQD